MGLWFKRRQRQDFDALLPSLKQWFSSPSGLELGKQQRALLEERLAFVFGYHCAHIGIGTDGELLQDCRIDHRVTINPTPVATIDKAQVRCSYSQWPIADRSLDAVFMHHALDFCHEPQQLLREASRTVISGGKIIIIGFNPYSLFNLLNRIAPERREPLSDGRYISAHRIQDWLKLLGYSVDEVCYGPFFSSKISNFLHRTGNKIQALARYLKLPLGEFYIITATREDMVVTPISPRWKVKGKRLAGNAAVERNIRRH